MRYNNKLYIMSLFNRIEQEIDFTNFDGRLSYQKTIYLLQELGLNFGFSYGWYKRGPYSPSAAESGFEIQIMKKDEDLELPSIHEKYVERLERYNELLAEARTEFTDLDDTQILELIGSLHFILNHSYNEPNDENAITRLNSEKPKFRAHSRAALRLVKTFFEST